MDGYFLAGGVFSCVLLLTMGMFIGRLVARSEVRVLKAELEGQLSLKDQQLTQAEAMYEELNEKIEENSKLL